MRRNSLALGLALLGAVVWLGGCGSNDSRDSEAPIFLTAEITAGPADIDVSVPSDITIPNMSITSQAKSPTGELSAQQDVVLNEWVVTPVRSDGGTVASPVWRNYYQVYVGAGGTANLQNFRIFPSDYFRQNPLSSLFPENGGYDRETGKRNIRQQLRIEIFGKTVAGENVSCKVEVGLNFFYVTP